MNETVEMPLVSLIHILYNKEVGVGRLKLESVFLLIDWEPVLRYKGSTGVLCPRAVGSLALPTRLQPLFDYYPQSTRILVVSAETASE